VPSFYGNAMFVLDQTGLRRGPRLDSQPMHQAIYSPFHKTGDFCGTCHDVGNVAVTKQANGTYRYNALNQPTPSENLHDQFPLERTYTEWKLSEFAAKGVDMNGKFGGAGVSVVSTCQDCHMPRASGDACWFGPTRGDLATHDFAGASAWVLQIIGLHNADNPDVDQKALAIGQQKAVEMLQKAADLELAQECHALRVRVINNSGHKLPTGHIEGRRVWLNVKLFDDNDQLVAEYGHYDFEEAHLDEASTKIYEMHVGLSDDAAAATGLAAGVTAHMALADTIVKDNRIPPRGFSNVAFEAGGAPVVAAQYADGQYWDDTSFTLPLSAVRAEVSVNYQTVTRHYIEALRDANITDDWGEILHDLWLQTDKGPPILMQSGVIELNSRRIGDLNCSGAVDVNDLLEVINAWGGSGPAGDVDGNQMVNLDDLYLLIVNWG
jgi:hypothetical protein